MMIPSVGDCVRVNIWNGIIRHIYLADAGRSPLIEIEFAKNVYKNQKTEFHAWEELEPHTVASSTQELNDEIEMLQTAQSLAWLKFQRGL